MASYNLTEGWSIILTRLVRYNRIIPTMNQYLIWTPELTRTEEGINLLKMAERTARMTLESSGGREAARSSKSANPPGIPAPAIHSRKRT